MAGSLVSDCAISIRVREVGLGPRSEQRYLREIFERLENISKKSSTMAPFQAFQKSQRKDKEAEAIINYKCC